MAVIFRSKEVPTRAQNSSGSYSYNAWYAKNKQRLSDKRKKLYQENPAYRARALEASKRQRNNKPSPPQDDYRVSFNRAAEMLGTTIWTLREWRKKSYYPEPLHRNGRLWFTEQQVSLLQTLQQFFGEHGVRTSAAKRSDLESKIALVYANWE